MMVVERLGNAGSYPGVRVQADDVFDGFEGAKEIWPQIGG
jgi:hypothetical protein